MNKNYIYDLHSINFAGVILLFDSGIMSFVLSQDPNHPLQI